MGWPDVVFDVVGTDTTLRQCTEMLKPNGRLVLIALPHGAEPCVPYLPLFARELNVIASRTYFLHDFPKAIGLIDSGKVDVKPLISKVLPLDHFAQGVELLEKHPEKYIKIIVSPLL